MTLIYARPHSIDRADMYLRTSGYRLSMPADGPGVWLVGCHGAQWFESWQKAYSSVRDGNAALFRLQAKARA